MGNGTGPAYDVFLSHSSKDKTWADMACAVLEREGCRCWVAPRDIIPGEEWAESIIRGIGASRIMVLIFSGHANASQQVRREVDGAISRGMPILPVRIEDVSPRGSMAFALNGRHWLDAYNPPLGRRLEELARSVQTHLGRQVAPVDDLRPPPPSRPRPRPIWAGVIAASLFVLVAMGTVLLATRGGGGVNRWKPKPPPPPRIPGDGPARRALWIEGDNWTVEGDQLVKEDLGRGGVGFGDVGWTDYDLTFEVCKSAGPDGMEAQFRQSEGKSYNLWLGGGFNKTYGVGRTSQRRRVSVLDRINGTFGLDQWHNVKISLREKEICVWLNGLEILRCTDDYSARGSVALVGLDSAGRFRNIKVAAPDGTVLWEGPPDLPGK